MADNEEDKSLEDFFSKKEKGKKTKGKGIDKKQLKTKSKSTAQKKSTSTTQRETEVVDHEWEDFKDPEEKDYTGLRIQALQIVEGEKERDEESQNGDSIEDVYGQPKKELAPGVWHKSAGQPQQVTSATPAPVAAEPGQKYVPGSYGRRRKPVNPPNIDSQTAFPSLSSSVTMEKAPDKSRGDFEMVKKGTKSKDGGMSEGRPRLDLGNRYDSLRN